MDQLCVVAVPVTWAKYGNYLYMILDDDGCLVHI